MTYRSENEIWRDELAGEPRIHWGNVLGILFELIVCALFWGGIAAGFWFGTRG